MSTGIPITGLSGDELHRLITAGPYGVMLLDPRGVVLFADPTAERMLRPEGSTLVGTAAGASITGSNTAEIRVAETGSVVELWMSPMEWNGRPAFLAILRDVTDRSGSPTERTPEGASPTGTEQAAHPESTWEFGILRDGTEERRAMEELRASEERFRLLAEYSQDAIFLLRMAPRPTVEYMSPAAKSVLGHAPDELTGDLDKALSSLRPESRAIVDEALRSPSSEPRIFQSRQRDGTTAWFEVRMFGIHDRTGQITAYEGNIRRVTERVLAEQEKQRLARQLERAEHLEALGRLAGGVAHDFNNLLAIITGTAELLAEDIEAGHPRPDDVRQIMHAAERGAALTRQLLIFSRREPSRSEVLDLNEVVTGIEGLLRRTIGEDIEFVSRLSPRLPTIRIDRSKLEQVVLNLVLNARGAMEQGGRLTLETDEAAIGEDPLSPPDEGPMVPPRAFVRLTVADTGVGMPPEVARRAFEPFFTTRGPGEGSGLGLATVHGVVKQAGGRVILDSRPKSGTTVQVFLPVCADPVPSAADAGTDAPKGKGETVLVVEDERPVREVVTRILARNDYEVLTAGDAAEAIEICADPDRSIDIVLTDLIMPGMPGTQLAERLRATIRPGVPVLFMSGYTAGRYPTDGAVRPILLRKPFDGGTLLRRVHEVLHPSSASPAP